MKDRVIELINQIGNSLDAPDYAEKILTECGKEILEIVEYLEEEVEKYKQQVPNYGGDPNIENTDNWLDMN